MDEPVFLQPGEGERVSERGHRVLARLPHLEVIELSYEPGFEGVEPHSHSDHTDSFFVLEGDVEFFRDGEWHRAGPGTWVSIPPSVEHGFRSVGSRFRLLNIHAPNVGFIDETWH